MTSATPARTLVEALADADGWPDGLRGEARLVPIAEIPSEELAALLLSCEDRAEELYREATGRHATSCMIATAWLYGTPFARAAADALARRGDDLRGLKDEAIASRRRGRDTLAGGGRDWLR